MNPYEGYTLDTLNAHNDFLSQWLIDLSDELAARPNLHLEMELSHLLNRQRQLDDRIVELSKKRSPMQRAIDFLKTC